MSALTFSQVNEMMQRELVNVATDRGLASADLLDDQAVVDLAESVLSNVHRGLAKEWCRRYAGMVPAAWSGCDRQPTWRWQAGGVR
jgi:hypothetical protein